MKVTILFLVDTLVQLAGSERNIYELTTRMDAAGYRPVVMCMRGGPLVKALRARGVKVVDLGIKRIYSPRAVAAGARLVRFIRRRQVSVLITYHSASDFFGAVIGRAARVPVLLSSRRDMGYMLHRRHVVLYRLVNPLFDRIITVSDAVRRAIAGREKVPSWQLVTLHNGVETGRFSNPEHVAGVRRELGIPDDAPVIGILAALRPVKGHVFFLEAAAMVARRYPAMRFLVAGWSTSAAYTASLRKLAQQLGIADRVIFTGGRADTPDLLGLMTAAVFASDNEGFSNAVIEAMAAGRPVIATDSGGTAEAVLNGETGLLLPPRDPRAIAGAILRIMEDPEEARRMGENGRKRVESMFSMERMVERFTGLCRELLAGKSVRSVTPGYRRLVKQALSAGLYYSGMLPVVIPQPRGRQALRILAYHRVTDAAFMLPGMSVRVANFEEQMKFIKQRYSPVSLDYAVQALELGEELPPNAMVITFDDGYRDNYINAFPVLKDYGIPATIFLSVQAIEERGMLWFDRVIEAFRVTRAAELDLAGWRLGRFPLRGFHERLSAAAGVIESAKRMKREERSRFVHDLGERLGVPAGRTRDVPVMMGWDEIVEMKGPLISFGSHGMSHTIMSRQSERELQYEVQRSRDIIMRRTGIEPRLFAYPNGGPGDFNEAVERVLREHHYAGACTLVKGYNDAKADRLALRRVCVSQGMEAGRGGRFSRPLFAVSLSRSFSRSTAAGVKGETVWLPVRQSA